MASCASGLMAKDEKVTVNMGGIAFTCGHCQFVCHPDKKVRKQRYKMILDGGVVIQDQDGSMRAVSPEEAEDHLVAMDQETRALYEEI
jgi:hypothetical protein